MAQVRVGVIGRNQSKGDESKMRGRKLRSSVYWQGAVKQKDVKTVPTCIILIGIMVHECFLGAFRKIVKSDC
jgi:hypothetical protein